jgi:hypothetical protein
VIEWVRAHVGIAAAAAIAALAFGSLAVLLAVHRDLGATTCAEFVTMSPSERENLMAEWLPRSTPGEQGATESWLLAACSDSSVTDPTDVLSGIDP